MKNLNRIFVLSFFLILSISLQNHAAVDSKPKEKSETKILKKGKRKRVKRGFFKKLKEKFFFKKRRKKEKKNEIKQDANLAIILGMVSLTGLILFLSAVNLGYGWLLMWALGLFGFIQSYSTLKKIRKDKSDNNYQKEKIKAWIGFVFSFGLAFLPIFLIIKYLMESAY